MKQKPFVFLDPDGTEELGLCLVIESPTGVEYANQCGGLATEQLSIEGYLIPLGMHELAQEIVDFFQREFRGHCYPPHNEWTTERTSQLEALVCRIPDWVCSKTDEDELAYLKLDRDRIDACIEAWIPVLSAHGRGILMLKNSD